MANGDPLRAKEIFKELDHLWASRWTTWRAEKSEAEKRKT